MTSIHNPTINMKLIEGTIEIQELSFPDAIKLYNCVKAQIEAFMNADGGLTLDVPKIISAISENIELGTWLALKSTRKDEAWLNQRSLSEVMDIVTEAAALNIGIIVDRIKNGGSRLRAITAGANPPKIDKSETPSESTIKLPT
jgi:hypothetical protein